MIILLNEIDGWCSDDRIISKHIQRNNVYAGLVVKKINLDDQNENSNIRLERIYRKILFVKTIDDKAEDLLFDSPKYKLDAFLNGVNKEKVYINKIVYLGDLLKEFQFKETLTNSDIKKIYKLFLKSDTDFFKKDYHYLPITKEKFVELFSISKQTRFPKEQRFNTFNENISFNPKVKIFTKK